jgi:hypothetical protein
MAASRRDAVLHSPRHLAWLGRHQVVNLMANDCNVLVDFLDVFNQMLVVAAGINPIVTLEKQLLYMIHM